MPNHPSILVFGSINLDLVARTPRLPVPGETILGHQFTQIPGGKGANQAVAVARLGIPTQMVGRVGGDSFGQELLSSLHNAGVQIDRVLIDRTTHSGVAVIAVDDRGENHIIVIPGANGQIDQTDIDRLTPLFNQAFALLLQFEIPLAIVQQAAKAAKAAGVPVILDPAPAQVNVPSSLYPLVDILTPNAVEAEQLVGFPIHTPADAERAAKVLQQRGVTTVIIKLGHQGVVCTTAQETFFVPIFKVDVVDTVAAGDAFNAGLAVGLAEGLPLQQALVWGTAAGALAVTKSGAQSSLPDRATFDAFLARAANGKS
jgi:ribokinase